MGGHCSICGYTGGCDCSAGGLIERIKRGHDAALRSALTANSEARRLFELVARISDDPEVEKCDNSKKLQLLLSCMNATYRGAQALDGLAPKLLEELRADPQWPQ